MLRRVCSEEKDEQSCCFISSSFTYGHELCVVTKRRRVQIEVVEMSFL